ncbi:MULTISPECIES: 3-hydroxyacyl-ACP dehydratase FabZ [Clostridium]|uniref:3-hydroxyacyl-[acyl-carrier-protein] dehydratase FabZ n=1 Tax=Clostridium acetobutylicum (strain ATCC 824 / DSM 792 / JCM 1419 / IAM 19013 / LMG 5710 / NBRC 13948 / NRRL B-527 / VKM B-1787 / 2291 / W) TaxID=272562 RepID=FABZ_CLOAB|nr:MULTISPECIES: 3-hydroxyacyl-ACP dehydratase FabZ [Clostridium]Q97DA9.1 RecName: Full=3-hydroxyacyl-[acyl-carrier-protein] dehydratase FabZ; AltName: Full=(3R)-hydroxymyristoyl-[acyl-carrier-protein] dehydratase; Short=(3R)-hydroxymyristoyl-ACP dehydrase; AltName: Full=Beta-hydroxyacyl-ACP dehydratase [Clostridium acetobutylicum ATCC 824]AAK81494.1 Hydroxymyristoyl-(acyl carrier protein) dehydratase [Clostridium acetobutylicum ATCC 824]ADZ22615.1 (3R)-hydroxymyristoyl-(acyl carrier protein) de
MSLSIEQIMEIIPHRYPMLLVDRVEEIEPGKRAVGYKNVTFNEQIFQGHYPGKPIMPGVLMIEALAQLGGVAILSLDKYKGKKPILGAVKNAKFRRMVVPGDVLKLEIEIVKVKGPAGIGKGIATVNGEKAVEAEITFMIV